MASTTASRRRQSLLLEQHRKLQSAHALMESVRNDLPNDDDDDVLIFQEEEEEQDHPLLSTSYPPQRQHDDHDHGDDNGKPRRRHSSDVANHRHHHLQHATFGGGFVATETDDSDLLDPHHQHQHQHQHPQGHHHPFQQGGLPTTNILNLMDFGRNHRSPLPAAAKDVVDPGKLEQASLPTNYGSLLEAFDHSDHNNGVGGANNVNFVENGEEQGNEDYYYGNGKEYHDDEYEAAAAAGAGSPPKKRRLRQQQQQRQRHPCPAQGPFLSSLQRGVWEIVDQLPAIVATILLILMVAIPSGVAYFPVEWSSYNGDDDTTSSFPLPGKESLGIRMALFATFAGQLVMTFCSQFTNPVSFQLLENVPFYHALAQIVFAEQGYGKDALATLFFLFGLSSIMVGLVFWTLGRLRLGRIAYFFPAHVLVGCIGGIGVFIIITAIEVTNNQDFTLDWNGLLGLWQKIHLIGLVLVFEILLRLLTAVLVDERGNQKFRFLAPIYFMSIVPVFYVGLWILGCTTDQAREWGYLFPDPACASGGDDSSQDCASLSFHDKVFNGHLWDVFEIIDFRLISWTAVTKSLGTLIALCSFSLIHVPINIPAFAVSSNVDVDMNNELVAHGYSNMLSGLFGGLQNVMTYSFSILYHKSGGKGIASCLAVTAGIAATFVYGPAIAVYFPRAMAGTLLLHIGVDLFLEGCYDSYRNFDGLEYAGIWFITIVMSTLGMTAALVAGIVSALSTYVVQSITHLNPIFRIMAATTYRSSAWNRPKRAMDVLDDIHTGRARILVIQLQGHLFFGNVADFSDSIKHALQEKIGTDEQPFIVVMDFSLVVGMDSSAAHAIAKLKGQMHKLYQVEVSIFVTGTHRDGFPCDYALSEALAATTILDEQWDTINVVDYNDVSTSSPTPSRANRGSISIRSCSRSLKAVQLVRDFPQNQVCNSLDEALVFAEDVLVARETPDLLRTPSQMVAQDLLLDETEHRPLTEEDERNMAVSFMQNIVPMTLTPAVLESIDSFVAQCVREEYQYGDIIWREGDESNSAKIVVCGSVVATVDNGTNKQVMKKEHVARGNIIGELGLVDGTRRLTTVTCTTSGAKKLVLYSMDRSVYQRMVESNQLEARLLERIAIRYLSHRVQHVSNRIFDTHCLPI